MKIEAWHRPGCKNQEIDAVNQSIFLSTTDEGTIFQHNGTNGIGIFTFSYHMFNLTNTYQEDFINVPSCVFNLTNTHELQGSFTNIPSLDSSVCESESMIESSPPWLWIEVAIVVTLFTTVHFIVSIVLVCTVRQKNRDLKLLKNQHGNTSDADRKYTCKHVYLTIYYESNCKSPIVHVYMNEYSYHATNLKGKRIVLLKTIYHAFSG